MTAQRVLGVGELLWDVFPGEERLGGAPFNVVANLRRLGHRVKVATAVGDDARGRLAVEAVRHAGVETDLIRVVRGVPTGTASVALDASGVPAFRIASPAAYESLALGDHALDGVREWRPVALVYGTLAQRSPSVLAATRAIAATTSLRERLYDVNLRPDCWTPDLVGMLLNLATVVKLNEDEARAVAAILGCDRSPRALGERIARDHGVRVVCVTRGADGAALWADGRLHEAAGVRVTVVDTVGAGDAFAAGLLHGLLEQWDPPAILDLANRLGATVASRPAALPAWDLSQLSALGRA